MNITTTLRRVTGNLHRELHHISEEYHHLGKFEGAVLVAQGNHLLLREAYGIADRTTNRLNTPETYFRIGSMTKSFTALLAFMFIDEGKLHLDDPVSIYRDLGMKLPLVIS
jgi:CubicO group peptidase (beta-lactamase class C family)